MVFNPVILDLILIAFVLLVVIESRIYAAAKRHGLGRSETLIWMILTPLLLLIPIIPFMLRLRKRRQSL